MRADNGIVHTAVRNLSEIVIRICLKSKLPASEEMRLGQYFANEVSHLYREYQIVNLMFKTRTKIVDFGKLIFFIHFF